MKHFASWINVGYELLSQEGHEGLQVERLARILGLNKSGFYHYFGDRTSFLEHLIHHHYGMVELLIKDIGNIRTFDPGYLHVLVNHPVTVMANMQLMRNRHIKLFEETFHEVNQKINGSITSLWSEYLGLRDQPELAMRYFNMTNALFYTRVSYHNLNYEFLHQVASEAKTVFEDLIMSDLSLPHHHVMTSAFINEADGIYVQRATS